MAAAAVVSMPRIMAWAWGLCTAASSSAPGNEMSAVNWATPQALIMADGRGCDTPILGPSGSGRSASGVVSPRRNAPASLTASTIFT